MKRKIISLALVLALCLSFAVLVAGATGGTSRDGGSQLMDRAGLLSDSEAMELNAALESFSRKHNAQFFIVTVESMERGDADYYVEYLYDSMNLGYGANRDGVLLMVCMNPREYRILSNGYPGVAIGVSEIDRIGDVIQPLLSSGDYAGAFELFLEECDYYLDGYVNGFPFDLGGNLMICLVIGLVVGLIVVMVLKGQLKSVRNQNRADTYVKPGSMQIAVYNDVFLYRNVTKVRRQSQNNSSRGGGGGSSRSVGGGSF